MAAKTLTPCRCSQFSVTIDGVRQGTNCPGTLTARDFAPGHDAKLKGFLIRWGKQLLDVSCTDGTTTDAVTVAKRFGFAHMVIDGIARPARTRKAKATPASAPVQGKVGRWVYTGTVEGDEFVYTDKAGAEKRTAKFTLVG